MLEKVNHRIISINHVQDDDAGYQEAIDTGANSYMERIDNWGQLRIAMMPNQNQQETGGASECRSVKIVEAKKPSFSLSFDNSPTELSAWLTQFKSYYDASKLHRLPLEQKQAFLRQGLAPYI